MVMDHNVVISSFSLCVMCYIISCYTLAINLIAILYYTCTCHGAVNSYQMRMIAKETLNSKIGKLCIIISCCDNMIANAMVYIRKYRYYR